MLQRPEHVLLEVLVRERTATRLDTQHPLIRLLRQKIRQVRACRIFCELMRGFRSLHFVGPCVTVFGSARFQEGHPYYALAREVGARLSRAGFTVMTGGGPGPPGRGTAPGG